MDKYNPMQTNSNSFTDTDNKSMDQLINDNLLLEHQLNPKVSLFIKSYLTYHNLSDAARASGLHITEARRIINKADVQDAIKAITSKWAKTTGFDSNELLERVNEISSVDPTDIFNFDGTIKDLHSMPRSVTRTIKKIKYKEFVEPSEDGTELRKGRIVDIEFHDKVKTTELLGKYEGIFKDKVEHTHDIGKNMSDVLIKNAEQRMKSIDAILAPALNAPVQNTIPADAQPIDVTPIPVKPVWGKK